MWHGVALARHAVHAGSHAVRAVQQRCCVIHLPSTHHCTKTQMEASPRVP